MALMIKSDSLAQAPGKGQADFGGRRIHLVGKIVGVEVDVAGEGPFGVADELVPLTRQDLSEAVEVALSQLFSFLNAA